MRNDLTKKELRTGDIVVTRNGMVGVVLLEQNAILYQNDGLDFLDSFSDELREINDDWDYDITAVYRAPEGSAISFLDYKDEEPIFERGEEDHLEINIPDIFKHRPSVEKKEQIRIIAQAFYGNRTAIEIGKDEIDSFVLGCLDEELVGAMHKEEEIDRTVVRIPGAEYLALIYNKNQEQRCLAQKEEWFQEDGYVMKPLATIPELGLEIYSRCIVCRMDAEGEPASLKPEDYELFMEYLAK